MPRASKQKDPNAPKRPLSAFFIFSQDERPKVKSQNASLSVADVAKVIGEKWRSAPDDLKRRYEKAAKEAKERYEIEMQAYKQSGMNNNIKLIIIYYIFIFSCICPIGTTTKSSGLKTRLRMNIYLSTYINLFLFHCTIVRFSFPHSVCSITSLYLDVLFLCVSIYQIPNVDCCCTETKKN
jgi:hypothetical protein